MLLGLVSDFPMLLFFTELDLPDLPTSVRELDEVRRV